MQRLGDILDADNKAIFEDFRDFTALSMSEVLNAFAVKLFMPEQADLNLDEGQILYVCGRAFRIVASTLNMGVHELSLEKK